MEGWAFGFGLGSGLDWEGSRFGIWGGGSDDIDSSLSASPLFRGEKAWAIRARRSIGAIGALMNIRARSTSAMHVACPGTQRRDGHFRDGDDGLLPVHPRAGGLEFRARGWGFGCGVEFSWVGLEAAPPSGENGFQVTSQNCTRNVSC